MIIGKGFEDKTLSESDIEDICTESFEQQNWQDKKILAIIPDHTRSAPIGIMFRTVTRLLEKKVQSLDFLIALGTHPPMSEAAILQRVGITAEEKHSLYKHIKIFNHHWNDPSQLKVIGTIPSEEVKHISHGLMNQDVPVSINRKILDYDALLIIGPTFPHEVVGFSGGDKYLFPGIAGKEIIDMFHWLGALITNPEIIGRKNTAVRQVVSRAASFVSLDRHCLSMVVTNQGLNGLYFGTPADAWSAAADLSDKVHIIYKEKPFRKILSCAPPMYEDLWTGGKCMYKLEPVVAEGGELIIYAPHISEISVTHGRIIEEIGYHTRDFFIKQWEKYKHYPGGVLAHSTHVKGIGSFENSTEKPRINVTLATAIPQEICQKINLGYLDPDSVQIEEFVNREDDGILYVQKAGEMLYRLKDDPFVRTG